MKHQYQCQVCGVMFIPKQKYRVTCCSRKCGFQYQRVIRAASRQPKFSEVYFPVCVECRNRFVATSHITKVCSDECRRAYARRCSNERASKRKVILERNCKYCGRSFTPLYGNRQRVYCSVECKEKAIKRTQRQRHRARLRRVRIERFQTREIFIRDQWVCQICMKPTNRNKTVPHPQAPTIDHIIPLAGGGGHERRNVRCAHFMCNSLKSSKSEGQLLLFG